MMYMARFEDSTEMERVLASPDSTPLDLSPAVEHDEQAHDDHDGGMSAPHPRLTKTEPDADLDRVSDREAVARAMVTDLSVLHRGHAGLSRSLSVAGSGPDTDEDRALSQQQAGPKKHRKRPREDEKICRVCSDKALAHNFDVISCESCKAFFRRNALKAERMECMFKKECPITIETRRFCSACRLQKCFAVGMKADLILDDMEKKARMEKVSENRARRMAKDLCDSGDEKVGSSSHTSTAIKDEADDPSATPNPIYTTTTTTTSTASTTFPAHSHHLEYPHLQALQPHHQQQQQQQQQERQHHHQLQQQFLPDSRETHQVQWKEAAESSVKGITALQGILMSSTTVTVSSPMLNVPGFQVSMSSSPLYNSASPSQHLTQLSQTQPQENPDYLNYLVHNAAKSQDFQQKSEPFQHTSTAPQTNPNATIHQKENSTAFQNFHRKSQDVQHNGQNFQQKCQDFQQKSKDFQHKFQDFQHVPRDLLPSDPHMYWRLSEEEKTLLTQLSSSYQDTIMTLPERVPRDRSGLMQGLSEDFVAVQSMENVFESCEKNNQHLINFVQRLNDFHQLREDDKLAVLKASGMRSVILRWTALYVVERNAWLTRFGECDVSTAATIFGHESIMQEMARFCRSLKTLLKNDVTLFVLMHCLVIFDPCGQNLVDRQAINILLDKYVVLLKHYLESEYSFLYTDRYLGAVMDKTVELRKLAEKSLSVVKVFRDYVSPL